MKIGQLIGASIRELASVGIFENGQTVLGDHARFPEYNPNCVAKITVPRQCRISEHVV